MQLKLAQKIFLVLFSFLSACQTAEKYGANVASQIPAGYTPPKAELVMDISRNSLSSLSADGRMLYFLGWGRTTHKQKQLYSYDLLAKKEKRLTFQDGEVTEGYLHPQGFWLYTSNTDEAKERPEFIRQSLEKRSGLKEPSLAFKDFSGKEFANTEIYRQSIQDFQIDRLTESAGFDGQIAIRPNSSELMYTSIRSGIPAIYRQNIGVLNANLVSNPRTETQYPAFSVDGKEFVFVEKHLDTDFRLMLGKSGNNSVRPIYFQKFPIYQIVYHPNKKDILLVHKAPESDKSAIFAIATDGTCERRLTFSENPTHTPRPSANGKELYFTENTAEDEQIYKITYAPPPCPSATLPIDSKK